MKPLNKYNAYIETLGYACNQKYEIKEAGNPEILEQRLIVMSTFSQDMLKGSIFEQTSLLAGDDNLSVQARAFQCMRQQAPELP